MNDDSLRRRLETAEQPLAPDPTFAAALRDELRHELGFIRGDHARRSRLGLHRAGLRRPPSLVRALFAAAVVVAGTVGLAALAGSLTDRSTERPGDPLAEIEALGRLRVAVRPDHPQVSTLGQPAAGFDVDVAEALAEQLEVRAEVVLLPADTMLTSTGAAAWDIALPSVATWNVDKSRFLVSSPYYEWPRHLVVLESSSATSQTDVAGAAICAVAGDAGEAWLRGETPGAESSPVTADVVTVADDSECFDLLTSREVAALVTARFSDADVDVRPGIRVVGGPSPEPRAVIIPRSGEGSLNPAGLLETIEAALDAMRQNGTLTRISQNRFGGTDLTTQ